MVFVWLLRSGGRNRKKWEPGPDCTGKWAFGCGAMSEMVNIGNVTPAAIANLPFAGQRPADLGVAQKSAMGRFDPDTFEFSDEGVALARATALSTLRIARMAAIRDEIHNNIYETPARINGTVERLLDVLV